MKKILTLVLTFFALVTIGQNKSKSHFSIIKLDPAAEAGKYEKAASGYVNIDDYRFYDKRRTVRFSDGKASIELFSAKELLDNYGKPVAPGTIMDPNKAREITFDITIDGNGLKPQFVK